MNYIPKLLFLEITSECNLSCKQCHMWKLKDSDNRLESEEYLELIKDFNQINKDGAIILTGGEVFLRSKLVFQILTLCNKLEIDSVINTNGTIIPTDIFAELLTNGPNKLIFSIDSHEAEIHDYMRGLKGAFIRTVSTISQLIKLRSHLGLNSKNIYISSILHNNNINNITEIVSFAKSLNIDGIIFQTLIPTLFSDSFHHYDSFFSQHYFKNIDEAIYNIDKLIEAKHSDDFIINSKNDLDNIKKFIRSQNDNSIKCKANKKNLVIDHIGNIRYCYKMDAIFPFSIGNIRSCKLTDIIYSDNSLNARLNMNSCKLCCRILNCNN